MVNDITPLTYLDHQPNRTTIVRSPSFWRQFISLMTFSHQKQTREGSGNPKKWGTLILVRKTTRDCLFHGKTSLMWLSEWRAGNVHVDEGRADTWRHPPLDAKALSPPLPVAWSRRHRPSTLVTVKRDAHCCSPRHVLTCRWNRLRQITKPFARCYLRYFGLLLPLPLSKYQFFFSHTHTGALLLT